MTLTVSCPVIILKELYPTNTPNGTLNVTDVFEAVISRDPYKGKPPLFRDLRRFCQILIHLARSVACSFQSAPASAKLPRTDFKEIGVDLSSPGVSRG